MRIQSLILSAILLLGLILVGLAWGFSRIEVKILFICEGELVTGEARTVERSGLMLHARGSRFAPSASVVTHAYFEFTENTRTALFIDVEQHPEQLILRSQEKSVFPPVARFSRVTHRLQADFGQDRAYTADCTLTPYV